ncbi:leucine-rich repeat-containing protein 74B [Alosa alosa]|uniref:leucine-rich repeat-containing protein 74B n=1 Tax=Alosa alosa TaxID=278164 RepID=UPI00201555FD|nr:leucine-rich repeat-containing protein 74B [Alosa alosa]
MSINRHCVRIALMVPGVVMGKKVTRESLLPSVLEDDGPETEHEGVELGGIGSRPPSRPSKAYSRGSVDNQCMGLDTGRDCNPVRWLLTGAARWGVGGRRKEEEEEEEVMGEGRRSTLSGRQTSDVTSGTVDEDYDTDLDLKEPEQPYDPTGEARYREACKSLGVIPASYFLRNMHHSELNMTHHGLGPQGTKALAVPLVTNLSIMRLNLRDNWMEATGGSAMAELLKENCYITEIDLSENRLGEKGAEALSSMLLENTTLVSLSLSANDLNDKAANHLSLAITTNQRLERMDLSHNKLGDATGEALGHAIAENTGMKSLSLAWNCIRGRGAIAVAKGLGANIFLRKLDLSYNGLGKAGAVALGEALRENNTLEELDISNNRIPPEGAIRFSIGLKVNKTIRILKMARNPMQSAGCFGILTSIQSNPASVMEYLDFSDITVNLDFDALYSTTKETFPSLQVKHGGIVNVYKTSI